VGRIPLSLGLALQNEGDPTFWKGLGSLVSVNFCITDVLWYRRRGRAGVLSSASERSQSIHEHKVFQGCGLVEGRATKSGFLPLESGLWCSMTAHI
jgi:hypothetical protein